MMTPYSRRRFVLAAGLLCAGGLTYGSYESSNLEVVRKTFRAGRRPLSRPVKILHLADLHVTTYGGLGMVKEALRLGRREKPDLICFTGDLISHKWVDFESYGPVLKQFSQIAPVFVSLGNHDGGDWSGPRCGFSNIEKITQFLDTSGATLLHNQSIKLNIHGVDVTLTGLGDQLAGCADPRRAFANRPAEADVTVVLMHNPDDKEDIREYAWDLVLCGHTHGGQISVPIVGPLYLPVRDRRFGAGLYPGEDRWLYITKGVGSGLGLRFNCPPDISLLTLV
jgi:uncharacterized protein